MALKFLDGTGLSHFWEKLKTYFVKGNARVFYGTCATAAATAEKAVTCADFLSTDLTPGSIISVKFSITNSAAVANLTLNVNSTGAKGIRYIYNGSLTTLPGAGYIKADQLYHFTYDGTYWVVQMIYNTNDDWKVRNDYGRFKVGTGGIFPNTIVLQMPDGKWASVVTSSSAETGKTKNSSGFLPDLRYVRGSGTAVASGGTDSTWQFWQGNVIDARYSFNIANTDALRLVNGDSIYLVGSIGSDGLFYLADKWWSNALPSSDDGKCYIYIGNVYSWYQIGLSVSHPAYIYKNGALRLYSGYSQYVGNESDFVHKSGDTMTGDIIRTVNQSAVVGASPTSVYQSPVPKYLWHDVLAFCRSGVPTYYTTADGETWTTGTLNKNLFIHKEAISPVWVLSSTIKGSRWEWLSAGLYASMVSWLVLGVSYTGSPSYFDLEFETRANADSAWTSLCHVVKERRSQTPIWIKLQGSCQNQIRITITNNAASASDASGLPLVSMRLLTHRWGDQGKGSEFEYPYVWDNVPNILPLADNTASLGSSGTKWKDVYTNTLNGTTIPASPKFTDTTYSAATTSAEGLMSAADKTKLNGITAGAEPNIQSNWNQTDTTADDYIKNKPGVVAAGTSTTAGGLMSQADKTKLNGIAAGAEVNQSAFSNVKVGSTTVAADSKTDTLELVAGSNVTLTPDATNDKVTIAATDTTYSAATTSAAGLMSANDKAKLDGITEGAEPNIQSDWNQTDNAADDYIRNKPGIVTAGTSTTAGGLMSQADKTKLNGIAAGAEVNVQSDWNQTTASADDYIKNKPSVLQAASGGTDISLVTTGEKYTWHNKVDKVSGMGLSTNDFTTALKNRLTGIEAGAEVNVQSDWTQTTTTADDYIKNKPTVPDRLNVGVNQQGDATLGLKSGADGTVFGEVPISDIIDAANAGDFASVKTATGTSPTTISAWTWTTLCTLTLDPGTYFIYGYVHDGPPNVNTLVRLLTWENDVQVQRQASATGNVSFGSNDLVSGICRMTSTKTVSLLVDNSVAISNTSSPYKGELIAVRVVGNVDTGLPVRTVHSNTEALFSESYKFPDGRLVINIRERFSGTITATTNNGGSYWVEVTHTNFPVSFVDVPTVVKATEPGTGNAGISGASKATTTNPGKSYLQRSTAYTTAQTIFINIRAEGYWRSPSGAAWAPESLLQSTFARTSASPAAVSVPSGSWTALCTFTGEANTTYLILYGAAFSTNATGYRQLHFAANSGSAGRYSPSYAAVNGEQTRIQASLVYTFGGAGTITLWAKQNSGSSLSVYGWREAIKLPS